MYLIVKGHPGESICEMLPKALAIAKLLPVTVNFNHSADEFIINKSTDLKRELEDWMGAHKITDPLIKQELFRELDKYSEKYAAAESGISVSQVMGSVTGHVTGLVL